MSAAVRAASTSGCPIPDLDWWADPERRELAAPWTDPAWNAARTRLFLASLRLHKAFLACAPTEMRKSLHGAMDVLNGDAPAIDDAAVQDAWRALFFVVPVVSTIFASLGRLFPPHGPGSLGWVLIDEAGQATPHAAAGAIWRARRAVVVGDPLQLEPVFTLPGYAQQTLLATFNVDRRWLPETSSAQSLADCVTPSAPTCTAMTNDHLWVGAPLRVHRRCDDPMFTVANTVAYNGVMVHAVHRPRPPTYPSGEPLPDNGWIDIASTHGDGHWIPVEGRALDELLSELVDGGHDPGEILVLSRSAMSAAGWSGPPNNPTIEG